MAETTGYKQYDTGRTYMAKMGDWRDNKDYEIELDGIGGVNILVKADVHRSGTWLPKTEHDLAAMTDIVLLQVSTFQRTPSRTKPRRRVSRRWPSAPATRSMVCPTTWSGTLTRTRRLVMRSPGPIRLIFTSHGIAADPDLLGSRKRSNDTWKTEPAAGDADTVRRA